MILLASEEFVKASLKSFFDYRSKNGLGKWNSDKSTKATSQTGWDLVFSRKNEVLYIEAKGGEGPFDSKFVSAIGAVLMRRGKEVQCKNKSAQLKAARYCVAFSSDRKIKYDLIRAFLYKLLQPGCLDNWKLLQKANAKYVYFVNDDGAVLELSWEKVVALTNRYNLILQKKGIELKSSNNDKRLLPIIENIFDKENWVKKVN